MGSDLAHSTIASTFADGAQHSRFVQRIRRRYGGELDALPPGVPDFATITQLVTLLREQGRPLGSALRVARR